MHMKNVEPKNLIMFWMATKASTNVMYTRVLLTLVVEKVSLALTPVRMQITRKLLLNAHASNNCKIYSDREKQMK